MGDDLLRGGSGFGGPLSVPGTQTDAGGALGGGLGDLNRPLESSSGSGSDATNPDNPWNFDPKVDLDLRGTGKNVRDALDEVFKRTGVPREEFTPTRWSRNVNGKSFPSEHRVLSGQNREAEVNVDVGHITSNKGPLVPHVGYQTPGKRNTGGATRGHILVNDVPYNYRL